MTELTEIVELRGSLRDYSWGSPDFISRWLGFDPRPLSAAEVRNGPEAEWWLGAHASAPSLVRLEKGWAPLSDWIAEDPEGRLGRKSVDVFGSELPFLFKILAAGSPLSLQAHPDARQARRGFEREEGARIPLEAPHRNYRDPNPKPELLCALTPFDALVGFRPARDIASDLAELGCEHLQTLAAPLEADGEEVLRSFFEALWREPAGGWLADLVERCRDRGAGPRDAWVVELASTHPGDAGAIAPLLLNLVHLEPGEAIYLPARVLHSYLAGAGLELMGNSDNVLRGGLTPKHVDVDELLEVLDFGERAPSRVDPVERAAGEWVYATPAEAFELSRLEIRGDYVESNRGGFEILLCERGRGTISGGGNGASLELARGLACAISARVARVEIRGDLVLHRAALPEG